MIKVSRKINHSKYFLKVFGSLILVMGVVVVIVHSLIYILLPRAYTRQSSELIDSHMEALEGIISSLDSSALRNVAEDYARRNNLNIAIKTSSQTEYYQGFAPFLEVFFEKSGMVELKGIKETELIFIRQKELVTRDQQKLTLQVIANATPFRKSQQIALSLLPYTISVSVAVALALAYFYSRKITRPILNIIQVAKRMQRLEPNVEIAVTSTDEIGLLSQHINELYAQVWQTIATLEDKNKQITALEKDKIDFFKTMSHELKTPLAKLHILLENMYLQVGKYHDRDKYLNLSLQVVDNLDCMVKEMLKVLTLPSLNHDSPHKKAKLVNILDEVIQQYDLIIKTKGLTLSTNIDSQLKLRFNHESLSKVCSNLLSNATKHTPRGGQIVISLDREQLVFFNSCRPIPQAKLDQLLDSDYQQTQLVQSTNGLGLYIVKTILNRLQLKFQFHSVAGGVEFKIFLPKK